MDKETKRLVFLKDSWRLDMDGIESEDHWYRRLEGGINIAAFSHGSNVAYPSRRKVQRTITQDYSVKYCNIEGMMGYIHYRTVQSEFYIPLKMFKDSKNLTQIMYDTILGKCPFRLSNFLPLTPIFSNTVPLRKKDPSSRYQCHEHHDHCGRPGPPHRLRPGAGVELFRRAQDCPYGKFPRPDSVGSILLISDCHRAHGNSCRPGYSVCKGRFTN